MLPRMPGTPPLGPAPNSRAHNRAPAPRTAPLLAALVLVIAALTAMTGPARAQTAAPCATASDPLGAASSAAVEAAVGCLVDGIRAARGLPALRRSGVLDAVAQRHGADMVARRYFAHISPSGGTVDKRARRAGYLTSSCWILGEDLGWAPPSVASAQAVVDAWMDSASHRAVILDPRFREIGVGLVPTAPVGDGAGATFVLEVGAVDCGAAPRAAGLRARVRVS
jgi:uncharacterized protein YkwD